jgi:hypothetical protein
MRLKASIVVNFELGPRRTDSMASEWIQARFDRYHDKICKEKLREGWQRNAVMSFPSMFQNLLGQVKSDVQEYNALFGARAEYQHCRCGCEETEDGFRVEVGTRAVRVKKQSGSTIIDVQLILNGITKPAPHFEVAPNEDGHLKYKHKIDGKDAFLEAEEASRHLLDPILCDG